MIDRKNIFGHPVRSDRRTYDNIKIIETGWGDSYTTVCHSYYCYQYYYCYHCCYFYHFFSLSLQAFFQNFSTEAYPSRLQRLIPSAPPRFNWRQIIYRLDRAKIWGFRTGGCSSKLSGEMLLRTPDFSQSF